MPKRSAPQNAARLTAVQKALRILEVISAARAPMSMTAVEKATGLPRPTVHRVTNELIKLRYVERDPVVRQHSEGPRLAALALDVLRSKSPSGRRREILEDVSRKTKEACHFGVLRRQHYYLMDHVCSPEPLGIRFTDAEMLPAHCAAGGKLLLALLADGELAEWLANCALQRHTDHSICDSSRLQTALAEIKANGVGIEDCEYMLGVVSVAVPVQLDGGRAVGALGISAPSARLPLAKARGLVPDLNSAARRLARTFDADRCD